MNSKQRNTLDAVFNCGVLKWRDIESLLRALGAEVEEGSGSRVWFKLRGRRILVHRPHPTPDAPKYLVKRVREFLTEAGIEP